jgi:excisionase family DNA binding protein
MFNEDRKQLDCINVDPLTVRISTAVRLTGISRSTLYELIQSGDLETVKVGRSTLIPFKALSKLVDGR